MKKLTWIGTVVVGTTLAASSTLAQEFPTKQPIALVVSFNPGGLADVLARITAEFLQRRLGQTVAVENRPGEAGAIALDYVAKAAPDGYTLHMPATEVAVLPAVRSSLPFKSENFTYLLRGFTLHPLFMVGPNVPASSVPELVAHMKANPGKVK